MANRMRRNSPPLTPSTSRNRPFADGNKRMAAVVAETFLLLNGYTLEASNAELVVAILTLAAGELPEDELAGWFREHLAGGRLDPGSGSV